MHETMELFDYEPDLHFKKMPKMLLGDSVRIKYIVLCLIQTVIEENKLDGKVQLLKVQVSVSDDDEIIL